jgi:hypothetical protein
MAKQVRTLSVAGVAETFVMFGCSIRRARLPFGLESATDLMHVHAILLIWRATRN